MKHTNMHRHLYVTVPTNQYQLAYLNSRHRTSFIPMCLSAYNWPGDKSIVHLDDIDNPRNTVFLTTQSNIISVSNFCVKEYLTFHTVMYHKSVDVYADFTIMRSYIYTSY